MNLHLAARVAHNKNQVKKDEESENKMPPQSAQRRSSGHDGSPLAAAKGAGRRTRRLNALVVCALVLAALAQLIDAQATKGTSSLPTSKNSAATNSYAVQSPGTQLRQQQQQRQLVGQQMTTPASVGKRKTQKPNQQQQVSANSYQREDQQVEEGGRTQQQQQQPQPQQRQPTTTEDPLADSEPALYGSVAGQPGVDFPAYTRIPKTSFTCEGKGFDFGFYADEEAQCQVYHVCWSGRRESFLCGVGTVFNQAILACDYWHSVDCSKSSQFYNVNSELGKAGAEPASGGQQNQQQRRVIQAANLPTNNQQQFNNNDQQQQQQQQVTLAPNTAQNFGEPIQQRRLQQQPYANDEANFDATQPPIVQQSIRASGQSHNTGSNNNFVPQRTQPSGFSSSDQQQQQRSVEPLPQAGTKATRNQPQAPPVTTTVASTPLLAPSSGNTLATPLEGAKRPRFMNMDLNQKVSSLIESPVRAPLKPAAAPVNYGGKQATGQVATQAANKPTTRRPDQQQANFAQQAVARAQQAGSQTLNVGPGRKLASNQPAQQQQQQSFDSSDLEEPQQQLQQVFDDSPVQTSTAANYNAAPRQHRPQFGANNNNNAAADNFAPQVQQLVIQSGGGPDGSSAITTQYDTIFPARQNSGTRNDNFQQHHKQQQQPQQEQAFQQNNYESSLDDASGASDDFRSAGAKAAASHNQNWYIMRTI